MSYDVHMLAKDLKAGDYVVNVWTCEKHGERLTTWGRWAPKICLLYDDLLGRFCDRPLRRRAK